MTDALIPNGLHDDIPDAVYHADRATLSASGARLLLQSPAKFRYRLDNPPEHKDVFDFGSAAHTLVLGKGDEIVAVDADSWRSKAARDARDAARRNRQIPLLAADYATVAAMAVAVRNHPVAAALLADGVAEQSGAWTDDATWIRLRFRPDWTTVRDGRPCLVDYKTAQTAEPNGFARKAFDFGYHLQQVWYQTGYHAITGDWPQFLFIVQEKEPPHLVSVVEFDAAAEKVGEQDMRDALRIYQACQETGVWPGYAETVTTISLPAWAQRRGTA